MIRMQLFYLNVLRGVLYGSGMFLALYILFGIKFTKRSIIDLLICIGWYYLVNTSDSWLLWKEILTIIVGIGFSKAKRNLEDFMVETIKKDMEGRK